MKKTLLTFLVVAMLVLSFGNAFAGITNRVSVDSYGNQGNSYSLVPSVSANGRYVAFQSTASNLVPDDTNGIYDVFSHDRQTGATEIVSVDSSSNQGNGSSLHPAISADGRYVVFDSTASNLVSGDTNGVRDVFVHDRQTGATEIVSVDSAGNQANGYSGWPSVSGDGRYVSFESEASNLVSGDTNGALDVFVHDRQTGITEIVSVDSYGNQAQGGMTGSTSISADGRYVAFNSNASNLVPDDTNGGHDVFVHDRQTGTTEMVCVDNYGDQGNGYSQSASINADGRYVAFMSNSSNLVPGDTNGEYDVFVHDRQTGTTEIASVDSAGNQAQGYSNGASISADGRYVAFNSNASNLVPDDTNGATDVFVHDRQTGTTEIVSVNSAGNQANGHSGWSSVSGDGRYVAFMSDASDLVTGDTNGDSDVFVRDRDHDYDEDGYNTITGGDCDDYDNTINPGAPEVKFDGIDQDCNGYDLTIDITKADYKNQFDRLTVWATSDLDAAADLILEDYGAMTWMGNRWAIVVEPASGDPGIVTVTGIEGSESAQTK